MASHPRLDGTGPLDYPPLPELIQRLGLREETPEVFYAPLGEVVWGAAHLDFVKAQGASVPRLRARICAHEAPDALQHQMLIAHHQSCYVRPHAHVNKEESLLVLEGEADALLFSPEGRLERVLTLGPAGGQAPFFLQVPAGRVHALWIRSSWFVFLETTRGPFRRTDLYFPSWSPTEAEAAPFLATLATQRAHFTGAE